MNDNQSSVNIKNKNALCYIPLVAIFIHFTEEKKTKELEKHIKYWIILFIWYAILNVVFWMLSLIVYLWISWFLWYKAYSWEDVKISFIDDFDKNKTNTKTKKDSSDKDDDVLNF